MNVNVHSIGTTSGEQGVLWSPVPSPGGQYNWRLAKTTDGQRLQNLPAGPYSGLATGKDPNSGKNTVVVGTRTYL